MPDVWGYCERCVRWFYCPRAERDEEAVCPACSTPTRVTRDHQPDEFAGLRGPDTSPEA